MTQASQKPGVGDQLNRTTGAAQGGMAAGADDSAKLSTDPGDWVAGLLDNVVMMAFAGIGLVLGGVATRLGTKLVKKLGRKKPGKGKPKRNKDSRRSQKRKKKRKEELEACRKDCGVNTCLGCQDKKTRQKLRMECSRYNRWRKRGLPFAKTLFCPKKTPDKKKKNMECEKCNCVKKKLPKPCPKGKPRGKKGGGKGASAIKAHNCFVKGTLVSCDNGKFNIEELRLGQRVKTWQFGEVGFIESIHTPDTIIEPELWRKVTVRREDHDGNWTEAELLRPVWWLVTEEIEKSGDIIELNLPEMSVEGEFQVLDIGACPEIEEGSGRVVMSLFRHGMGEVWNVKVEDEENEIGTTGTHPFYSMDRLDFVPVEGLVIGEAVLTESGVREIEGIAQTQDKESVYNIEVDGDHCYRVGESGVLVHNESYHQRITAEFTKPANSNCTPCASEIIDIRGNWRSNTTLKENPKASYVYAVFAIQPGSPDILLKIGDTENIERRFSHYVVAAGICKDEYPIIHIEFWMYKRDETCSTNPSTIAADAAKPLCPKDDKDKCPWDNALFDERLGRPGPGTPGEGIRSRWEDCKTYNPVSDYVKKKKGRPIPTMPALADWEAAKALVGSGNKALAKHFMVSDRFISKWKRFYGDLPLK